MDLIALAFYAVVCACLSLFAPSLGGRLSRFAVGALVGIFAASVLPFIRTALAASP